jgi:hypothetical protein
MAINRAPFNALVDDNGTGTTGSVWNKAAIQGVILDPVDAAIVAAVPAVTPIVVGSKRGTSTDPAVANLHNIAVGTVGLYDTIEVEANFHTAPGQFQALRLFYLGAASSYYEIARLDAVCGAGTKQIMSVTTRLRAAALGVTAIEATSWGAATTGPGQTQLVFTNLAGADTFISTWTLALQYAGVPAGDTLWWAWTVTKYPKGGPVGLRLGPDGHPLPAEEEA